MIVIGSEALRYHMQGVVPNDLDLVGTYEEAVKFKRQFQATSFYPINEGKCFFMRNREGKICEIEIAWEGSRAEKLLRFMEYWGNYTTPEGFYVPSLNVLYMLKMSHRYLKDSPHFLKTMRDIQRMRLFGARIQPEHEEFYKERMKDTYTYKHPKLDVKKGEFFDNGMTGVWQKYDHDSIHEAVAVLERPAYTYFKPDKSEVMVCRDMWRELSEKVRLYSVLEEAYVLALERSLIPYPNAKTPKEAFDMALMKVCTSITSGWFREYAWENYDNVQAIYNENYVDKFNAGVQNGIVQLNKEAA